MATLRDIEKMTGVSLATVSRILNGNKSVSQDKVDKVLAAVKELGYQRPDRAPSSGKKQGNVIMVLTSSYGFWHEMYDGIVSAAREAGYTVLIHYLPMVLGEKVNIRTIMHDVLREEMNVVGVIIAMMTLDEEQYRLLHDHYPVVFCGQYYGLRGACSVSSNDVQAAYELGEQLLSTGKRRFAIIEQTDKTIAHSTTLQEEREQGFLRATRYAGIPDENVPRIFVRSPAEVAMTLQSLMQQKDRPDAIFTTHAYLAIEAQKSLEAMGYKIPEDVALASFDINMFPAASDGVTTICQNFREFGEESMHLLESILRGETTAGRKIYIDHKLLPGISETDKA